MSDNKRYYWLKLNENFFEDDTVQWLEEQENGKEYVIFYLKLCLKSLKDDGSLIRYVGQKLIPYDVKALSRLTSTPADTVAVAMKTFAEIGLVEVKSTGEIYLSQIDELIGSETEVAKRVRKHRARKSIEDKNRKLLQCNGEVTKCNTEKEIEIEKELDIELDINKELSSDNRHSSKINKEQLDKDFEALWKLYPNKKGKAKAKKAYAKAIKDGVTNKQIQDGIVAYTKEIKAKNTDKEYIKHGSTWFNNRAWEDEYDTTPTQPKRYGQSSYQEPVPEFMQEEAINESDVDLELDDELTERIKALTDRNNKNNDSP